MWKPPWDGPHDDMDCKTLNVELVLTFDEISYHKTHWSAKMDKRLRVSEGTNHKAIQVLSLRLGYEMGLGGSM